MGDELEFTVTFKGSQSRVRPLLASILRELDGTTEVTAVGGGPEWSDEEFRLLWSRLSAKARTVLRTIARKPDGYKVAQLVADLESELKGSGHALAGALSSVGHRTKQFPGKVDVYKRDYANGVFTMPHHVADLILAEGVK